MKKTLAIFLAAVMLMACLAGCGKTDKAAPAPDTSGETAADAEPAGEKVELLMSHHPYVHALPSIYASENSMYDDYFEYNIDLYANGPVQNEAIASGAWEVGTTGLGGAVLGVIGYDMKILGFTTPDTLTTDIWVRGDSPLASAKVDENGVYGTADDWKGLTILCNRGTICHMVLLGTLEYLGITEADVNIIDASVANCYTAFLAGEGDVVCLWDALGAKAEVNGWVKVSSASAVGIELPAVIVATDAAVKEKPEAVKKWLEIYLDASSTLLADYEGSASMLYDFQTSEGISVTEEDCTLTIKNRPFISLEDQVKYFTPDADGNVPAKDIIMTYADFMLSQGNITQEAYDKLAESDFVMDYVLDIKG